MRAELPYLAAGTVTLIGGTARHKGLPPDAAKSVFGTVGLVMVASALDGTRVAPLVRAFGLLLLLASVMAASRYIGRSPSSAELTDKQKANVEKQAGQITPQQIH